MSGSCERTGNSCGIAKIILPKWPKAIWAEWWVHVPQVVPVSPTLVQPIDARPAQVFLCTLGQFRAELLDRAIHRRATNRDAALFKQIYHVLIGQRIPQIPTYGTNNDLAGKAVVFERRSARHTHPQKPRADRQEELMQQSQQESRAMPALQQSCCNCEISLAASCAII